MEVRTVLSISIFFLVCIGVCGGEEQEDSDWYFDRSISYYNQGVDDLLPHLFFDGEVLSQRVVVGYTGFHPSPSVFLGLNYLQSPSGGSFSDPGDRVVFFVAVDQQVGPASFHLRHSYKHVNMMDYWFWYKDPACNIVQSRCWF